MSLEEEVKENIKNNLVKYRNSLNLTQKDLVSILGLNDASTYRSWETGRSSPKNSMLVRLARVFGITVDELLSCDTKRDVENSESIYGDKYLSELSRDEKIFLMKFRRLSNTDKKSVEEIVNNIVDSTQNK